MFYFLILLDWFIDSKYFDNILIFLDEEVDNYDDDDDKEEDEGILKNKY